MTWFHAGYQFKKKITLLHTQVSGGTNLTNFPVLISRVDPDLQSVGNGGKVQNASGFDIIFVDATESTQLNHEIEQYVASTGEVEMWVRIPTLSYTVDTVIYMYFNNASISTSQENVASVWDSNFAAVYHMTAASGLANSVKDSTSNANNASPYSNYDSSTLGNLSGAGQIAGAQTFNGSSNSVSAPTSTSLNISGTNTLTMSAWVARSATTTTGTILSHGTGGAGGYMMAVGVSPATANQIKMTKFGVADITLGAFPADTAEHHLVALGDGTNCRVYIDGALSGTFADTNNWLTNAVPLIIGSHDGSNDTSYWAGVIDEVRISNVARSAGWIATEYNNQSNPAAFHIVDGLVPFVATRRQGNARFARIRSGSPVKSINPFGISAHLDGLSTTDATSQMNLMQAAGIHWVRLEFSLAAVEPTSGTYTWSNYDFLVNGIRSRGMQVIALLDQYNVPSWYGTPSNKPPAPADYATFASAVATHYAGQIPFYEIGNEPNGNGFWYPAANAAAYTALLQAAYPAIHAADSNAKVISAGLASAGDITAETFLTTMYSSGAHGYMDYVAFHPYSWPASPDFTQYVPTFSETANIMSIMTSNGDGAKNIIITEVGWPSTTASGGVTEAVQAAYIQRLFQKIMYENYQYAIIACLYDFIDDGTDTTNPEQNFGLLHTDYTAKPSYTALQKLTTNIQRTAGNAQFLRIG